MEEKTSITNQVGKPQHGAKTLFWYFSLFWTLGATAFATGAVWFQVVNKFFPKEIGYGVIRNAFNQGGVKYAIAALIVGAPAFLFFSWMIRKAIDKDEIKLTKGPRQWVGYLILFIVVATALGDIIATVLTYLNGDFTIRFLLKSLIILLITSWIFVYFWLSLKSEKALKGSTFPKIALIVSVVLIVASLITGFSLIDSPTVSRAKATDEQRLNDLFTIQSSINSYYLRTQELPTSLEKIDVIQNIPVDPRTDQPYGYDVIDQDEYKLCATFETDSADQADYYPRYYGFDLQYQAGENCFSFLAGQEQFPNEKSIPLPIQ